MDSLPICVGVESQMFRFVLGLHVVFLDVVIVTQQSFHFDLRGGDSRERNQRLLHLAESHIHIKNCMGEERGIDWS